MFWTQIWCRPSLCSSYWTWQVSQCKYHRPWDNPNGYETTVNSLAQMCLEKQKRRKKMENVYLKRKLFRDSLLVQWLRIHLLMQGTQVRSLVRKLRSRMLQGSQVHAPQLLSLLTLELECHNSRKALTLQGKPHSPQQRSLGPRLRPKWTNAVAV